MQQQLRRHQQGISLTETLIAMMILAVGMLGVAGMQTANVRNSQSANQRTMATILASNMAERIRANRTLALTGVYALSKTCSALTLTGSIQNVEKTNWMAEIQSALGANNTSCGQVTYTADTRTYVVTVSWDDSRAIGGSGSMNIVQVVQL
jgi:type IV pilus assembly protein PilV